MRRPSAIQIGDDEAKEVSQRLLTCVTQADSDQSAYNEDVDEGRELFDPRPERSNKPWEDATELHVPFCEITRMQLEARLDRALLCVTPTVHVEDIGKERGAARDVENFLKLFSTQELPFREKFLPAVDGGLTDGSCCVYAVWRQEWRDETRWRTESAPHPDLPDDAVEGEGGLSYVPQEDGGHALAVDETGEPLPYRVPVRRGATETVLAYDAPELVLVETGYVPGTTKARWGTYPARNADIQRSTGVFVRYEATGDELLQRVQSGVFDEGTVRELRTGGSGTATHGQTATDDLEEIGTGVQADSTFQWRGFNLIDCIWRYMPLTGGSQERRDMRRPVDWLFTLDEDSVRLLQARPLKEVWWHGKRPLVNVRPFRKRSGIHGTSAPDLVGDAQATMTELLHKSIDASDLRIKPPLKVKRGLLATRERADIENEVRPGGIIEVDNPEAVQQLLEVVGDSNAGLPWFEQILQLGQRNNGVSDQSTGIVRGTATATEVQIASAEGDALFSHLNENVAEGIRDTFWLIKELCYQHVDHESVQRCWAQANPDNEPKQGMLPGEWELSRPYRIEAWGTKDASNKAIVRQQWSAVYQIVRQLPEIMIAPDDPPEVAKLKAAREYAVDSSFYTAMGLGDPQQALGTEQEHVEYRTWQAQQQQAMQQQAMQQQAMQQQAPGQDPAAVMQQNVEMADRTHQQKLEMADRTHQQKLEQMVVAQAMKQPADQGMGAP